MLELLGLDQHSEMVYVAILSEPGINAECLAEKLDLSSREIQCALDQLKKLTLLQARSADEGFHAISPEHGMEILLAVQQAELASFQQRIELSRAAAMRLIAEHISVRRDNDAPEVEYLAGIDAIRARLGTLSASVRSEVMNFSPTKQAQADISEGKAATARYMGTGVRSRSIYSHSALRDPVTLEYILWLRRSGFELRSTPALPSRMVIFDRKVAILPMSPDDSREGAVVLYGKATVTAFCALFDWIWERALPVNPGTEKSGDVGEAIEIEVIWLLAQGYTDETVAKKLGVSPRTCRRIVNSVMRRLGAQSRFQAGAYAERSGLLDRSPLLTWHHVSYWKVPGPGSRKHPAPLRPGTPPHGTLPAMTTCATPQSFSPCMPAVILVTDLRLAQTGWRPSPGQGRNRLLAPARLRGPDHLTGVTRMTALAREANSSWG